MLKQIIYFFLIFHFLIDTVSSYLNIKSIRFDIPEEFSGFYDDEKYSKSQQYLKVNTLFSFVSSTFNLVVLFILFEFALFNTLDLWVRSLTSNTIYMGLFFYGVYTLFNMIIGLPFSIYKTFTIEAKFGFNTTTVATFVVDKLKSILLTVLFAAPLLALVLWFFESSGSLAWIYIWVTVSLFQLLMLFLFPSFIMPLFNKFKPLENQSLKKLIVDFANKVSFPVNDIFEMDGSKRSKKSNAFFAGFGKSRRVVFYDTLLNNHTEPELLGVFAHEVGHYKCKHLFKQIALSISTLGLILYLLNMFLNSTQIFIDFNIDNASVYLSLLFFSFLVSPLNFLLGVFSSILSRQFEFEADAYAVDTTGDKESMILALKKLSVDNLSNLTPHPLKVFLDYSHPPVLERIKAIRSL